MLTSEEIERLVAAGEVGWSGERRGDSLLLRLGGPLQSLVARGAGVVDLADQPSIDRLYEAPLGEWDTFEVHPGRLVLCRVAEPLRLGPRHAGLIGGLSHLARVGLGVHITSPWVLPGWDGHLTLELHNVGPLPLRIHNGMPIGRVVLFTLDGPVTSAVAHPFYGSDTQLGSRYADEFGPDLRGRRTRRASAEALGR